MATTICAFRIVVEENIIQMADRVFDILKSKYLISPIQYKGLQRIENLEIPEDALREAIFNSIIHKDYTGAPIQLSVYNDKMILWNEGRLPVGFTIETLLSKHTSRPYNKNIASIFFKAGFIEAWGRGIAKIINGFTQVGFAAPIFAATMGGVMVTIDRKVNTDEGLNEGINEGINEGLNEGLKQLLSHIIENEGKQSSELAQMLSKPQKTVERWLALLKKDNKIEYRGSKKTGGYFAKQ